AEHPVDQPVAPTGPAAKPIHQAIASGRQQAHHRRGESHPDWRHGGQSVLTHEVSSQSVARCPTTPAGTDGTANAGSAKLSRAVAPPGNPLSPLPSTHTRR